MLINCVVYQNGRKLADIPVDQIHLFVHEPDCFVWVALANPEPAELEAMQKEFGLHELAVEDARHGHQRPKIEEYNECLFVVLQMIEPANEDLNVGENNEPSERLGNFSVQGSKFNVQCQRGVETLNLEH